jgi:hypothetical protein
MMRNPPTHNTFWWETRQVVVVLMTLWQDD